jgi:acetyl-CoA acetyltransferase
VKAEQTAVISGLGMSEVGRRLAVHPWTLTSDAARAAIADAGLTVDDIDGISTFPGAGMGWPGSTPGMSGAGVYDIMRILGIRPNWFSGGQETAGQLGSIINAVMAVAAGLAEHVLCFRTVYESSAQQGGGRGALFAGESAPRATGLDRWRLPFGAYYPCYASIPASRYLHRVGAGREELGQIALVARANAGLNPAAVYRQPMDLDTYLDGRMIATPLCIYDCDVPVDGSVAFVVSSRAAIGAQRDCVSFEAVGSAAGKSRASSMMWARTDLKQGDVDVAELYDGFTFLVLEWLEALGFCNEDEAASFIEGGRRIALDGELPLSTGGGQLSGGRLHGFSLVHEACVQLRGAGGLRQVSPKPEVAVVSNGTNDFTGCMLLTAE